MENTLKIYHHGSHYICSPTFRTTVALEKARVMELTDKNVRELTAPEGGETPESEESQREGDNISVARTALTEGGRSVRSVHSTRSLAVVAEKARSVILSACSGNRDTNLDDREDRRSCDQDEKEKETALNDLVVVTHKEDGGLRLGGKNTVSNLPYIRRNPAI